MEKGGDHLPTLPVGCSRPIKDPIPVTPPDTPNDHQSLYLYSTIWYTITTHIPKKCTCLHLSVPRII